jgi:hypothetical protein
MRDVRIGGGASEGSLSPASPGGPRRDAARGEPGLDGRRVRGEAGTRPLSEREPAEAWRPQRLQCRTDPLFETPPKAVVVSRGVLGQETEPRRVEELDHYGCNPPARPARGGRARRVRHHRATRARATASPQHDEAPPRLILPMLIPQGDDALSDARRHLAARPAPAGEPRPRRPPRAPRHPPGAARRGPARGAPRGDPPPAVTGAAG